MKHLLQQKFNACRSDFHLLSWKFKLKIYFIFSYKTFVTRFTWYATNYRSHWLPVSLVSGISVLEISTSVITNVGLLKDHIASQRKFCFHRVCKSFKPLNIFSVLSFYGICIKHRCLYFINLSSLHQAFLGKHSDERH